MKLYNTMQGPLVTEDGVRFARLPVHHFDELFSETNLIGRLRSALANANLPAPAHVLAPIGTQEVWAAGVTYFRSRSARIEESKDSGGGSFYDRVYTAPTALSSSSKPPPAASSVQADRCASAPTPAGPFPSPNSPSPSHRPAKSSATPSATT